MDGVDVLTSTADITTSPQQGKTEILRSSRTSLNMDKPEHHVTDLLKKREMKKAEVDVPSSKAVNDLCGCRPTLVLFGGQPLGGGGGGGGNC